MKVRIRFTKSGSLVYIGHLDVMRYFQKLFRRAQIPVKYSEGFSPHQILSFSPPLPLGMESSGEYADVELTEKVDTKTALSCLSSESVKEIRILSFKELPEKCENAMAAVRAARYEVICENAGLIKDPEKAVSDLMSKDDITVIKRSKKSEKEINIRPLIFELKWDNDPAIFEMLISSGSIDNIKPELVMNALAENEGIPEELKFSAKRIDQYTYLEENLISLDDIGKEII